MKPHGVLQYLWEVQQNQQRSYCFHVEDVVVPILFPLRIPLLSQLVGDTHNSSPSGLLALLLNGNPYLAVLAFAVTVADHCTFGGQ